MRVPGKYHGFRLASGNFIRYTHHLQGAPVSNRMAFAQSKFHESIGFMRMTSLDHWKMPGDASLHGLIGHNHGKYHGFRLASSNFIRYIRIICRMRRFAIGWHLAQTEVP